MLVRLCCGDVIFSSAYLLEGSVDIGDDNVKVTPPPVTQEVKSRLVSIISENRG
ncbi:MAG: hypothetical protein JXA95_17165 [Spirochaetales bacterium]|nr:hypothetical protein [Spirochaetales bacterium]